MQIKIATWNMDHWKGVRRTPTHTQQAWDYVATLKADVVLLQEAVPPPPAFAATVFPPRDEPARWHSGGRAAFGTAVVVFGHAATEVESRPLGAADRTQQLPQSHPGAFVAAKVALGNDTELLAVSLYGVLDGPLLDKETYSTTSLHRSLSDLTPALYRARMRPVILGGDLNVSTQFAAPWRAAHRAVFDRITAFGVEDCTRATAATREALVGCPCDEAEACIHVQTHRHPQSQVPWQNDYLFASRNKLMKHLVSCQTLDEPGAWALSDHCPVVATFEV
jgi:exonuclease III